MQHSHKIRHLEVGEEHLLVTGAAGVCGVASPDLSLLDAVSA